MSDTTMKSTVLDAPQRPSFAGQDGMAWVIGLTMAVGAGLALATESLLAAAMVPLVLLATPLFFRPFAALCLVMGLVATEGISALNESQVFAITALKLVGGFLVVALLIEVGLRRAQVKFDIHTLLVMLFLLLVSFSNLQAVNHAEAVRYTLTFLQLGLLWWGARLLVNSPERFRILGMVVAGSLALGGTIGMVELAFAVDERVSGLAHNSAVFAADLFAGVAFAWYLSGRSQGQEKSGWILVLGLALLALFLTVSRGAWLAFIPSLLVGALLARRVRFALVATAGALLLLAVAGPTVYANLRDTADISGSDRGHYLTLKAGAHMIQDYPLTGVGIGNYIEYYMQYTHDERGIPRSAHNSWVAVAAEMGLPTLVVFLLIHLLAFGRLYLLSRRAAREGDRSVLDGVGVVAFVLTGFILIGFTQTLQWTKYLWLFLALAVRPYEQWSPVAAALSAKSKVPRPIA